MYIKANTNHSSGLGYVVCLKALSGSYSNATPAVGFHLACSLAKPCNAREVILKGDLDGTILSHAIFHSACCLRQAKNCIQLASYNIVCGCDCRRVFKTFFVLCASVVRML